VNTAKMAYGQARAIVMTWPSTPAYPAENMKLHAFPTLVLSAALACCVAGPAFAAGQPSASGSADQPQTVSEILSLQRGLRERLDRPYGEYSRFDESALARMKRAQDKVFVMLKGVNSLDQLSPSEKTDLSNSLDEIKAILLANESNRQICHRERKTGSNMIQLRCETVAAREANARDSREAMREIAPSVQTERGN
jgi:hypothetical protein